VRSDSSVAHLYEVLQVAFGWEDMHLNRFEIRGREYGVYRDGGTSFAIDAHEVRLCDLKLRRLERFTYEYDFGDSWIHDLRLEAILPADPRKSYPTCVGGECTAPPKDCGAPYALMEDRWKYSAKGGGMSREDVDDLVDDLDDEEWEIQRRYDRDRFDRRRVTGHRQFGRPLWRPIHSPARNSSTARRVTRRARDVGPRYSRLVADPGFL
jgi:hypothetical protein